MAFGTSGAVFNVSERLVSETPKGNWGRPFKAGSPLAAFGYNLLMRSFCLFSRPFALTLALAAACLATAGPVPAQARMPPVPTPLTITVQPGARQAFGGFGASGLNFGREYQTLTLAQRQTVSGRLWRGLKFKTLRLWFNADQYAPTPGAHDLSQFRGNYVDSGMIADARRNGVTTLLLAPDGLPPYMAEKSAAGSSDTGMALKEGEAAPYADLLADFLRRLKQQTGVVPDVTGVQNEPNDRERFTPAEIALVVKHLRADLDAQGMARVKIIAPENASADGSLYAQLDALRADPAAWAAMSGIASHSYNMAATAEAAPYVVGTGKSYWMTEASDNGPEAPGDALRAASLASRFLSDMNHRVTDWVHFVGFEVPDPHDNATRILAYTPRPFAVTTFQKYYYYEQLSRTFDVGAVFRASLSGAEGDMTYTYGKKPGLTAAAALNPDGTWGIGLSNFTSSAFTDADDLKDFAVHNGGHAARTFAVTVRVPELARVKVLRFAVRRSNSGVNDVPAGTVIMRGGIVLVPAVGPLDLVTLRSLPATKKE